MNFDITLGQFFPGNSVLHRLDPRTKILLCTFFIIAIFLVNTPAAFLFLALLTFGLMLVSRISFRVLLKAVKPVLLILLFTAILNVILTTGEGEPLFAFWVIKIYRDGIVRAIYMAFRVIVLILGTSLFLTYTTSPIVLTDGLESLLSPLKKLHVPVHTFSMMMTIALRFIPTLIDETERIMNAQKSRGADFTSGGLVKRAKALIPLLVPLFVSSFKRAEELAIAMECRCYRGDEGRTKMQELRYTSLDFVWYLIGAAVFAAVIGLRLLPNYIDPTGVLEYLFYII